MTTRTKTIAEMLKDRRGDGTKAGAVRSLGTSRQMYDTWESGLYLPGEEFVPAIAQYLEMDEEALALQRYYEKLERAKGVYLDSFSHSLQQPAVAA